MPRRGTNRAIGAGQRNMAVPGRNIGPWKRPEEQQRDQLTAQRLQLIESMTFDQQRAQRGDMNAQARLMKAQQQLADIDNGINDAYRKENESKRNQKQMGSRSSGGGGGGFGGGGRPQSKGAWEGPWDIRNMQRQQGGGGGRAPRLPGGPSFGDIQGGRGGAVHQGSGGFGGGGGGGFGASQLPSNPDWWKRRTPGGGI